MSRTPRRFNSGIETDRTIKVVFGVWLVSLVVYLAAIVAAVWFVVWVVIQVMEHYQII